METLTSDVSVESDTNSTQRVVGDGGHLARAPSTMSTMRRENIYRPLVGIAAHAQ